MHSGELYDIAGAPGSEETVTVARKAGSASPSDDERWCISIAEAPLSEEAAADIASVLAVLSDPIRLRLLTLVATQGEVCSCDLEAPLGRTQPTISHHTRVLAEAGLLSAERRGRLTFWTVPSDRLAGFRELLNAARMCVMKGMADRQPYSDRAAG